MTTLRLAVADIDLSKGILLCIVFIGLNILDAWLTGVALGLGSYELNPFLGAKFGSSMLIKGLIACQIVITLILFKRGGLLKPLSLGMLLICAWNGFAILSWS
jgi:hypothetical protein